ncbi:BglII/BstYI family type II restriction endonuclease [Helicobacter mehlei]|uniref:Restriction endonuclease n=1 Tax=Helicobacter mehlei TaxID=2316080 RepID=A0A553UJE3_9HELI|nr:BglII/BstYI family type II restriction endonuclease [Helicobacter mehlei]TSA80338.1 restriction endonuclease [Helicobacter mehlei]
MKIAYWHSHLNGLEFLQVHHLDLWQEIQSVILNTNAYVCQTKISQERGRQGNRLFSPAEINKAFEVSLNALGWLENRQSYYLTPHQSLAFETMYLNPEMQKQAIEAQGEIAYFSYNQTDFLKERIAIELQFGKYAFYDLFVKHMAFFVANAIDVGIEIVPTKAMCAQMSSGIAYYESEVYNLYRQGRNTPAVPLILIGIEP